MQVMVWAAYRGHISLDHDTDAAEVARQAEKEDLSEELGVEEDNPFLQAFTAQDDCEEVFLAEPCRRGSVAGCAI